MECTFPKKREIDRFAEREKNKEYGIWNMEYGQKNEFSKLESRNRSTQSDTFFFVFEFVPIAIGINYV